MQPAWRALRSLLIGRTATCIAILASVLGISAASPEPASVGPILMLLGVLLALGLVWAIAGVRRPDRAREIALGVLVVDVLLLGVGEYLLGGANAFFGLPLYGILIAMAASLHSRRAAWVVALLGAGSFAAMAAATQFGVLAERPPLITASITRDWALSASLINASLGVAMAVAVGSLARLKDDALARSRSAEHELTALNAGLEIRIARAVGAERRAREDLERRNDALVATLGQVELFASAISHDLRNPVTAAAEALRLSRTAETDVRDRMVDLAAANLERVDAMVIALRDVMRAVGRRSAPRRVEVEPLVRSVVEELCAERIGREPAIDVCGPLGLLEADESLLRHVFRNLLANAFDHNPMRPDLHVAVSRDDHAGTARFRVSDDGCGIPAALRSQVLEPFQRGSDSNGMGLGLTLAAAIVAQAGGALTIEDTASGTGVVMSFTWPLPAVAG